ncbi:MAG: hypothetical protein A2Y03_03740 [Omnitrophica WOR_2 bacterium GWF2_38_59]|nr:MAG: hypothetical protein A2Y06_06410 [Omnitrophica WOR_2 bacterium GWA2_37_7]OGX24334.1 MAG: hypothetical protein A2Y03_03740 [Omnitrophica WOR_2 bacterium GWF2_38_59]OGX47143.1 MAG: hypothetical protein A2243_04835 [Omnitrophica WOR_2 bacterium RIFOXYA2_FULL_38_17]OGX54897.1 MAG: hypothetical protein A2267_01355 [Omnitrophica WOR_2 bacterium RIFOXYA12_FULL_38_10]OGX57039.1 MAG: hypothetical protein A2447_02700 [Omnitrophica WOR_2 bacterium RIFOXYC2_FULL_38_12]OGX57127.1 MAG: hypothetical 
MEWNLQAESKYKKMLSKIPLFHRQITQEVVDKMAPQNAQERQSKFVEEEDIIKAFLCEVPQTFYSIMIRLMEDVGFDYKKYEKQ